MPLIVDIDAVRRSNEQMTCVFCRCAFRNVVFQICRVERRQKFGLIIEVVEQLALEGIHVAPFELRRGNETVVRRLQVVLVRFVPIEHIAHDGTGGINRFARHLG